jgi:hypothetical protein
MKKQLCCQNKGKITIYPPLEVGSDFQFDPQSFNFCNPLSQSFNFFNSDTLSIKAAMINGTVITCDARDHYSLFTAQNTPITVTTPTQPNPCLTHLTHVQPNHCTLQFTLNITKQVKPKTHELKKAIHNRQSHD